MPTTIDSMTGVEIKSPFFDTAVSLELFPVHPNVLKNPNAPQKNRVALIYGSNGSGKSTIAQGFREYAESVVPKTVELNPTAGASIIKMSSGMKSGKIFVFDEKYISRNIKVQESGLGTIVLLGEQVELEKRLEELKAQIAKLQANIDSKAENVEKFNLVSDVISPEYWKAAITKKLQSPGGWAETSGIRIKRNQIKTRVTDAEVDRLGQLTPQKDETLTREKFTELFSVFDGIETSASPVAPEIRAIDIPEKVVEDTKRLLAEAPQKPILTEREQELLQSFGIEVLSNAKGFLSVKANEICPTCLQLISEEHRTESLRQIENILNREVEEYRKELESLILPEIEAEHYQRYSVLDSELLGQIILQIFCSCVLQAGVHHKLRVLVNQTIDIPQPVDGDGRAFQHKHIQPAEDVTGHKAVHDKLENLPLPISQTFRWLRRGILTAQLIFHILPDSLHITGACSGLHAYRLTRSCHVHALLPRRSTLIGTRIVLSAGAFLNGGAQHGPPAISHF